MPTKSRTLVSLTPGFTSCAIHPYESTLLVGDTNGNLYLVDLKLPSDKNLKNVHNCKGAITCVAFNQAGTFAIAGSSDCKVHLFRSSQCASPLKGKEPSLALTFLSVICRTESYVNSIALHDNWIAIASGEDKIRILQLSLANDDNNEATVTTQCTLEEAHDGGATTVCFDRTGTYLASSGLDKTVKIWNLANKTCVKTFDRVISKDVIVMWLEAFRQAKSDSPVFDDLCPLQLSWSADGKELYVPFSASEEPCVSIIEKQSWEPSDVELQTNKPYQVSLSPNGLYLAVVDQGSIKIVSTLDLSLMETRETAQLVTSLTWSKVENALIYATMNGTITLWSDFIPEQSPTAYKLSDSQSLTALEMDNMDLLDEEADEVEIEETEENIALVPENTQEDKDLFALVNDALDSSGDQPTIKEKKNKKNKKKNTTKTISPPEVKEVVVTPQVADPITVSRKDSPQKALPKRITQKPFQPGESQFDEEGRRFMTYNHVGMVTTLRLPHGQQSIEVEFHDRSTFARDSFTDNSGICMAAIDTAGVAFVSKSNLKTVVSFRGTSKFNWHTKLDDNETAQALIVGKNLVGVATNVSSDSRFLLRMFTPSGIQFFIYTLPGPVVCMTSSSTDGWAAIVYSDEDARLRYLLLDTVACMEVCDQHLVLTRGATLKWIGFTSSGLFATCDSLDVVRVRQREYFNAWLDVADLSTSRESTKSSTFYVTSVSDEHVMCIEYKNSPQVMPRPVMKPVSFSIPLLVVRNDHSKEVTLGKESNLFLKTITLNEKKRRRVELGSFQEVGNSSTQKSIVKMEHDMDKMLISMVAECFTSGLIEKGVDLANMFHSLKALQLMKSVAQDHKLIDALAKLNEIEARHFPNNATKSIRPLFNCNYQQQGKQEVKMEKQLPNEQTKRKDVEPPVQQEKGKELVTPKEGEAAKQAKDAKKPTNLVIPVVYNEENEVTFESDIAPSPTTTDIFSPNRRRRFVNPATKKKQSPNMKSLNDVFSTFKPNERESSSTRTPLNVLDKIDEMTKQADEQPQETKIFTKPVEQKKRKRDEEVAQKENQRTHPNKKQTLDATQLTLAGTPAKAEKKQQQGKQKQKKDNPTLAPLPKVSSKLSGAAEEALKKQIAQNKQSEEEEESFKIEIKP